LQNALATVAVATELDVPFETTARALEAFKGVERRFQVLGHARGITVVDDYGHHPTEIAAVMTAARAQHPARLVVIFQPHRYSRTQQQRGNFGAALAEADEVVLTEIYSAGEDPIPGVTIEALAEAIRGGGQPAVRVIRSLSDVPAHVAATARSGDLVVMLGAGSIGAWGAKVLEAIGSRRP
jgi:UDP-N-acetylmuramate--alanine ligase